MDWTNGSNGMSGEFKYKVEERKFFSANFLFEYRTELLDFHQPKTMEKSSAYKYLFEWIKNYFQRQQENIIHPLYLQHEGLFQFLILT